MPNMNCRVARAGPWLALLLCLLLLLLILPTAASAGSSTILVPPPNGKDDTANIQAALKACVAKGPGCTVQLQAGKYLTKEILVYNFKGTFKGMGMDITTIEALPELYNSDPGAVGGYVCQPNLTTCIWADLFTFVDGNISVSDLAISLPWVPATIPSGAGLTCLDALVFTGKSPTDVTIDRIRLTGAPSTLSTDYGYSVCNGIHYSGIFPRSSAPYDWYLLGGSFTVRNSYVNNASWGISQDAFSNSAQVIIGGSPATGNHVENTCGGMDLEASENSLIEVSYNESSGTCAGMWVVPNWVPFLPSSPSRYLIHDNKFIGTAEYSDGMYLYDETPTFIQAAVWNNTVEVQTNLSEGFGIYYTKSTAAWNNTITGSDGFDGIGLWGTTLDTVISNNVGGFTVDSTVGNAQIYLDPNTTQDLVVCESPSTTVLNQGTNNTVIGCQQPATTPAAATENVAPAVSTTLPIPPKGKPWKH